MAFRMNFRNPNLAFEDAVKAGRLSRNPESPIYAGHYMYMGAWEGADQFKNIITRQYLA